MGFTALSYGIVFSGTSGIKKLADYVASGSFDRFMLSPKNLLVRVATSSFGISALDDIVFGVVCLLIYGFLTQITVAQIFLISLLVFISVLVFLAAAIAIYSASFLFTDANW